MWAKPADLMLLPEPSNIEWTQEPINRSLHLHCILESTFARIFLFLELPFLQEAQFYRENLFPVRSAYKHPKWNGGERRRARCRDPSLLFPFCLVHGLIFATERTWFVQNKVNTLLVWTRAMECIKKAATVVLFLCCRFVSNFFIAKVI